MFTAGHFPQPAPFFLTKHCDVVPTARIECIESFATRSILIASNKKYEERLVEGNHSRVQHVNPESE